MFSSLFFISIFYFSTFYCFNFSSCTCFYTFLNLLLKGGDFISKITRITIIIIIFISLFISIFFIPTINSNSLSNSENLDSEIIITNPNGFVWPIPGYTRISSYFGKRKSPTSGASSSHSGIDIPAPEGSKLIAVNDGEITFCKFLGAGGYTITLSFDNYKVSYCHCDPNFIVSVGDQVKQGQVIGYVGPKNVYGVKGNQYFDSNGTPTNRCNNWSSSTFRH